MNQTTHDKITQSPTVDPNPMPLDFIVLADQTISNYETTRTNSFDASIVSIMNRKKLALTTAKRKGLASIVEQANSSKTSSDDNKTNFVERFDTTLGVDRCKPVMTLL